MSIIARSYVTAVSAAGLTLTLYGLMQLGAQDLSRFGIFLALTLLGSTLKIRLPKITGTISVGFVFVLFAAAQFTWPETVIAASLAAAVQCLWRPRHRPGFAQVLFNASALALSAGLAYAVSHQAVAGWPHGATLGLLALATSVLFTANTAIVSMVLCLVERKPLATLWNQCHMWSFSYYMAGAAVAALMTSISNAVGWTAVWTVLPLTYLLHFYYRAHIESREISA